MLDEKTRYLQIAFNYDLATIFRILPSIPKNERILIEAGTPFIKREGFKGIKTISQMWKGYVVADLKLVDGATGEVELAYDAGASAATVVGNAPTETIDMFIKKCDKTGIDSMIDMIGVADPLRVLMKLKKPPKVVILHKGRDEELTRGKVIEYKHINRIRSKFNVFISAAGGVDLKEARSAIFNGANIVVVNIVSPEDPWTGIKSDENVAELSEQFLKTIK